MTWYKKAQEFVGGDAVLVPDANQLSKTRNVENQFMPSNMSNLPAGFNDPIAPLGQDKKIKKDYCEQCGNKLDNFEKLNYYFKNNNGEKEEAYRCSNCGYKNHYTQKITRKKKIKKRKNRRRRSDSFINIIKTSATPANPYFGTSDYNNTANQPWGRLDLTEDQRVIRWEKIQDGFASEFDSQKQKRDFDYKIVKVRDKSGKIKYIRIKKKTTGGDSISPANTWTQKGRVKKQRRFKEDGRDNKHDNPGAWPHNRNLAGPGSGFYQAPYSQNMDADMRERAVNWYDHIRNRGMNSLSRPY